MFLKKRILPESEICFHQNNQNIQDYNTKDSKVIPDKCYKCPLKAIERHGDALQMSNLLDISQNSVFSVFSSKICPKVMQYS